MEPKAIEPAAAGNDTEWQRSRMEIEQEWHVALHDEASDRVPSKLPISLPPVRSAA